MIVMVVMMRTMMGRMVVIRVNRMLGMRMMRSAFSTSCKERVSRRRTEYSIEVKL